MSASPAAPPSYFSQNSWRWRSCFPCQPEITFLKLEPFPTFFPPLFLVSGRMLSPLSIGDFLNSFSLERQVRRFLSLLCANWFRSCRPRRFPLIPFQFMTALPEKFVRYCTGPPFFPLSSSDLGRLLCFLPVNFLGGHLQSDPLDPSLGGAFSPSLFWVFSGCGNPLTPSKVPRYPVFSFFFFARLFFPFSPWHLQTPRDRPPLSPSPSHVSHGFTFFFFFPLYHYCFYVLPASLLGLLLAAFPVFTSFLPSLPFFF